LFFFRIAFSINMQYISVQKLQQMIVLIKKMTSVVAVLLSFIGSF